MKNKKYKITLVLTCESLDGSCLSDKWFEEDLMREISCCVELYDLENIKVEEVKNDVTGKQS